MTSQPLDALDRSILAALQDDGRLSQVDLAERVPLSPTAIARRIRALEEAGVIEGYQARISRRALGLTMTVMVSISLKSQSEDRLAAFEKAVNAASSIVSCHLMSGEDDYVLTVLARDLADFEAHSQRGAVAAPRCRPAQVELRLAGGEEPAAAGLESFACEGTVVSFSSRRR